jgi:hypothetical protein
MNTAFARLAVVVAVSSSACVSQNTGPTADEGAAYLGLTSGTTLTYAASDSTTETHTFKDSDVQLLGALTVGMDATANGFAVDERSLTLAIDVERLSIMRFFGCLSRCATADQPIDVLQWPLEEGQSTVGEANVTETLNGEAVQTRTERHTTTVGAQADITVPAGTFPAFAVTWSRTVIDATGAETATDSSVLQWAPDVGIVRHETFEGITLELQTAP